MSSHQLALQGDSAVHCGSPTRSRHHESLFALARVTPLQKVLRLTSLDTMELFITLAGHNPAIARVIEDLDISLDSLAGAGYPAHVLRELLRIPRNIETLTLHLPAMSPPTILNGLLFPRLTVFTTNLPHHFLVPFLSAHPAIVALTVEACASVPSALFGRYSARSGNFGDRKPLTDDINGCCSHQRFIDIPTMDLTIEFFADDYDILTRIAASAPNLRKLKLVEKPRAQRRFHHTRRPWNDVHEWHLTLLRLPYLEELLLRTHLTVAGPRRSEETVVAAWVNGTLSRSRRHPNLFHIGLLQGTGVDGGQRLSHWFKTGSAWDCFSSAAVGATHSFVI